MRKISKNIDKDSLLRLMEKYLTDREILEELLDLMEDYEVRIHFNYISDKKGIVLGEWVDDDE